jgi:hypothetical protein
VLRKISGDQIIAGMRDIAVKLYEDATAAQRRAGDQDG